jgi:biotin carboxylase
MRPCVLFVGGGTETLPGVLLARSMGLAVAVSDGNPRAPCMEAADFALVASTYDPDATVARTRHFHEVVRPINGVLCMAVDVPHTVAAVARGLGLPGISSQAAQLAMDKLAMKECLHKAGIPVPWFAAVESPDDLRATMDARGRDLVIKPVDSRGARGVQRLAAVTDCQAAYEEAKRHSPTGRVMVEEFLSGPQVSTESLIVSGQTVTPGFSDRNYALLDRFAPFIIEDGGDMPSRLSPDIQEEVHKQVGRAAAALGIERGAVKGDIVVCQGKPFVIELAARLSGGYFCSHQIPRATGVDLVGACLRQCLGETVDASELLPRQSRGASQRWLFAKPGVVTAISGVEAARRVPGVFFLEMRVAVGDSVAPVHCHPARLGVVMAEGDTREAAIAATQKAAATIVITTTSERTDGHATC